ncbi:MAG TPA: hypothetical protein VGF34_19495 [Stellaceae bacterium]
MSEDKIIDFLRGRFARIDERFDRIERRLELVGESAQPIVPDPDHLHDNPNSQI